MSQNAAGASSPAAPTAAAPPKQTMSALSRHHMSVIVSYPVLLAQEEQMVKTRYDVSGWCLYLTAVDDLMESMAELIGKHLKHNKLYTLGGREHLAYHDLPKLLRELIQVRRFVAERAVALLPGSYKLWLRHLLFLTRQTTTATKYHHRPSSFRKTQDAFERALVRLHKMPRIWLEYLAWLPQYSGNVTDLRRLYNRALESLPVTQHDKIWQSYLKWVQQGLPEPLLESPSQPTPLPTTTTTPPQLDIPDETILRVMRRHAQYFHPPARETLAQACLQLKRYGEAALWLLELLNDTNSSAVLQATRHELWMTLAQVCTQHPAEVQRVGLDWEALVRGALKPHKSQDWSVVMEPTEDDNEKSSSKDTSVQLQRQLGEMEGTLWAKLAEYYTRLGEFDMARSIYEEALESVSRVRDFSILFDAYVQLEEGVIEAMMELEEEVGEEQEEGAEEVTESNHQEDDWDILLGNDTSSAGATADIELALARAEYLTSRRPLLLNRVLLRQNPHNVGEWLTRSDLYEKLQQTEMAAASLEEALGTVNARKAVNGMPSQLVLKLATLYEQESAEKARELFDRICRRHTYVFKDVDDLAQCYAAWVELELRQEAWDDALDIARSAVASPDPSLKGAVARLARGLPKSLRLWDLLLDLEESLGTVATTKDSYNRAIELKLATPMHILNFASFLTDHKYFEESFTAYERGVELFAFPHPGAKLLWKSYLEAFVKRFGGSKMERTRDLFERCVDACPPEEASELFILNGKFEEEYGLTKRALSVYKAMCHKVPPEEKYTAYQLYISKTVKYMGVPATRDIYHEAIAALQDTPAAQMCLDFAKMEASLQEIERARAVLAYGAQLADPRRNPEYWKTWHEFEVSHGNEETFREMLRVKRSVQAAFSTVNYNAAEMSAGSKVENLTDQEALSMLAEREGVEVENRSRVEGFVQSKRKPEGARLEDVEDRVAKLRKATAGADVAMQREAPQQEQGGEEIDIDDLEDEDEEVADTEDAQKTSEPTSTAVKDVSTKTVPAAVFGGLATEQSSADKGNSAGALEHLPAAATD